MVEKSRIGRALHGLHKFEVTLLAAILIAMVLVATAQILLRNFFATGLIWADPLLRAMLLWLGLLGAVVASHDNKHISIDLLSRFVPAGWHRWLQITTSFFTALVCLIVAFHAGRFVLDEYNYQTPSSISANIPAWFVELIIPVAFALIALRYLLLIGHYWVNKPVGRTGS